MIDENQAVKEYKERIHLCYDPDYTGICEGCKLEGRGKSLTRKELERAICESQERSKDRLTIL